MLSLYRSKLFILLRHAVHSVTDAIKFVTLGKNNYQILPPVSISSVL